jgi:hypothetical protein
MHAKCQREMVEKKRRGVPNGAANSVKLTETANIVDSLTVQVECFGRPATHCAVKDLTTPNDSFDLLCNGICSWLQTSSAPDREAIALDAWEVLQYANK